MRREPDYDEVRAARMLALLMSTAPEQQLDTLAIVCRAWMDRQQYGWGQAEAERLGIDPLELNRREHGRE